ncbi:tetratricopeptide repeat protein [Photobacterium sanguinicancri]|uniref:tetratricopeptide repeat protein n=1 Tax=Photobacterium sanguinicancri TaxID=875932 RepID=UPI0021C4BFB3|nr:hypothetical protein [Photobacterium sanguinicancri]
MKKILAFTTIIIISLLCTLFIREKIKSKNNRELISALATINSNDNTLRDLSISKLKEIADSGNSVAQYRYAEVLLKSNNINNAIKYLQLSSKAGELISTELLGLTYLDSKKSKQKLMGFNLLNDSAINGLSTSQLYLGMCFQDGDCGFPQNQYLAYHWLNLALKNGEESAKLFLSKTTAVKTSSSKLKKETHTVSCKIDNTNC